MKRRTYQSVYDKFKQNDCLLLDKEYKNGNQTVRYIASCGHENRIRVQDFFSGHGKKCKSCSGQREYTIEDIRRIFSKRGCTVLSSHYENAKQKISYVAKCGHENHTLLHTFLGGHGDLCIKCSRKKVIDKERFTLQQVQKMFESKRCKLLTNQYTDAHQTLEYVASCGHKGKIQLYRFRAGQGILCPLCRGYLGEKRLGELLEEKFGKENIEPQYKICANGKRYYIDFFIPSQSLAIEYNGRQHYESTSWFSSTSDTFKEQEERDKIKSEWCLEHGIRLVVIDGRKYETAQKIRAMTLPDLHTK